MRELRTTMTKRGQVTVPAEVRRLLGLRPRDKVVFRIEDGRVQLAPVRYTIESAFGSVQPLPTAAEDFEEQIRQAKEERAERTVRELAAG